MTPEPATGYDLLWPADTWVDDLGVYFAGLVAVIGPGPVELERLVYVAALVKQGAGPWIRFESDPVAVSVDHPMTIAWALGQLRPLVDAYDPDYDVDGPLDALDHALTEQHERLADQRAKRQTEAWRHPAARPDPTAILDL